MPLFNRAEQIINFPLSDKPLLQWSALPPIITCMGMKCAESDEDILAEKRIARRKSVSIPCTLRMEGEVYAGQVLDLSSSGAFIQTKQLFTAGDEILVIFNWRQRGKPLYFSMKAQVTHVGRFLQGFENFLGFGARFTGLSVNEIAKLNRILDALASVPERKYEFY
jgi:Tfp pilus assembly protein PilZ